MLITSYTEIYGNSCKFPKTLCDILIANYTILEVQGTVGTVFITLHHEKRHKRNMLLILSLLILA